MKGVFMMNETFRAILVLFLLVILVIIPNIKFVKDKQAKVVERFGKFHRIIDQRGIYILIPLYERVVESVPLEPIKKHFKLDDEISIEYTYEVFNVEKFVYESIDSIHAFHEELINHEIHEDGIDMLENMNEISNHYGFKVIECKINNK